jgi:hypothetical protein
MDGGALQMSEDSGNYKGFRIEKFSGHSARPATLAGLGRGEGTGGFRKEKGFLIHLPDGGTKLVPTIKHARQYIDNYGDIQKSKKDGEALQLAEDAKHGAKEVCAECKQPISYHQHSRKWNHSNTQDSEKPHQSVRVRPEGWSSAWHKSVEKAEKGMPRGMPHPETGKGGGKIDKRYSIGRSYTGHASGKPQYVVQFANEHIGQHETREGAEALARQHAAKRNADLGFTQKSEKSDVIGEVGKSGLHVVGAELPLWLVVHKP